MAATRRVLITGVSRFWGAQLAKRLEAHESIDRIVAVDTQSPAINLERTDFIRADIRHSLIGKLLRALDIDTVVHASLIVDPRRASPRTVHETNVIGTMNLTAACAGADSPVQKLVVKSSTAIYGCEPDDPSFWSEQMERSTPPRDSFTRDLDDVEDYARDFGLRRPQATVTVLRFADVLGAAHDTPFARLFSLPAVPTVIGFDPRLQFLHEDDAVDVLERAVIDDHRGTFNVAGDGIVLMSQACALLGKRSLPIIPFAGGGVVMSLFNRIVPVAFPSHLVRLLHYGRVVDTSAVREQFGALAHPTRAAVEAFAHRSRVPATPSAPSFSYERELEEFLRSTRAAANGHPTKRRPRKSPRTGRRQSASSP